MTTYFGESGSDARYYLRPYTILRSAINTLSNHLYQGTAIKGDFAKIKEKRYTISRGLRFTYCTDINTLIIKVPTKEHKRVTRAFTHDFARRIEHMGLTDLDDLCDMGATTYKGRSTKKEANSCWRPIATQPNPMDWPTLVFKVSVTIHIKKWECRPATPTYTLRSNRPPAQVPAQIQTVDINANGVVIGSPPATTPPLVLHFQNILLRQPVPPEQDVIYTAQNLQRLANGIWAVL
ncbi:hypothetical protein V2W45_1464450 [Cenococcum geophilum]